RLLFGAEHLKNSLAELKYKVVIREGGSTDLSGNNERSIWILEKEDPLASGVIDGLGFSRPEEMDNEGYSLATENNRTLVYGEDPSGALYGCYTLSDLFNEKQPLPAELVDAPEMVLRGACVGLQKPYYLPER